MQFKFSSSPIWKHRRLWHEHGCCEVAALFLSSGLKSLKSVYLVDLN